MKFKKRITTPAFFFTSLTLALLLSLGSGCMIEFNNPWRGSLLHQDNANLDKPVSDPITTPEGEARSRETDARNGSSTPQPPKIYGQSAAEQSLTDTIARNVAAASSESGSQSQHQLAISPELQPLHDQLVRKINTIPAMPDETDEQLRERHNKSREQLDRIVRYAAQLDIPLADQKPLLESLGQAELKILPFQLEQFQNLLLLQVQQAGLQTDQQSDAQSAPSASHASSSNDVATGPNYAVGYAGTNQEAEAGDTTSRQQSPETGTATVRMPQPGMVDQVPNATIAGRLSSTIIPLDQQGRRVAMLPEHVIVPSPSSADHAPSPGLSDSELSNRLNRCAQQNQSLSEAASPYQQVSYNEPLAPAAEPEPGQTPSKDLKPASRSSIDFSQLAELTAPNSSTGVTTSGMLESQLNTLIEAVEEQLADPNQTPDQAQDTARLQGTVRLLKLLADRREDALQAIPGADETTDEFWRELIFGLGPLLDPTMATYEADRYAIAKKHLDEAARLLQQNAPLEINHFKFVAGINGFGEYTEFPDMEFHAGDEVYYYAELDNFINKPCDKGFQRAFKAQYHIYDSNQTLIASQEYSPWENYTQSFVKDYCIASPPIRLPDHMLPGRYFMRLMVTDLNAKKTQTASLQFRIVTREQ